MNKAILGSLATIPLVTAGVFGNMGSAEANLGQASFSSETRNPLTTLSVTQNALSISPGDGTGQVNIGVADGVFAPFAGGQANIKFPNLILGSTPDKPVFLDFGLDDATAGDGLDVFKLTQVASEYGFLGGTRNISNWALGFDGIFVTQGRKYIGEGSLTFQIAQSRTAVETALAAGQELGPLTFSGITIAIREKEVVPEPTTLAGLGLVAGALAVSRRGKKNKA